MDILKRKQIFWILNTCLICCKFASGVQIWKIKKENLNIRLVSCTFLKVDVHNQHDCTRACNDFGGKCKSMNYNKKDKQCELNAKEIYTADESEIENDENFIYSDITEWPKSMRSGCSQENCLDHQLCRPLGKDNFKCVDIPNCGDAPRIVNGSVSAPVTLNGAIATYACDFGFENIGNLTTRKCLEGTWSGEKVTCTIKDCGPLANILHGTVSVPATTHGNTATYSCTYGYERVAGDLTRKCVDGTWEGIEMTCMIKDCGPLAAIAYGSVSWPGTTHGSIATYSCEYGYERDVGDMTRKCMDGTWDGIAMTCKLKAHVGCYVSGESQSYYGQTQYTANGISCQRWDTQSPHGHTQSIEGFPESSFSEAGNYCRDPDGEGVPWCYTIDPGVRYSLCNVPVC